MAVWRLGAAGLAAILVSIGLARFAYTLLTPALIAERWFSQTEVFYLGATNFAGYFAGALFARRLASRVSTDVAIRLAIGTAAASFIACAWPAGFSWFFLWRLLSGVSGGAVMVLVTTTVLAHTPAHLRGRMSGTMFGGVGVGIALAGISVPILVRIGLTDAWLFLGGVAVILALATWRSWPPDDPRPASRLFDTVNRGQIRGAVGLLIVAYAFDAVGFVPHTVFWIDYIARGLDHGLTAGGAYWVLFGLGAAIGPPLAGMLADRLGIGRGLAIALFTKGAAVALPIVCNDPICLALSSVVVGALTPGIPALMSGRMLELLPPEDARRAWSWLTVTFATAQAGAGYGLTYLFGLSGSYRLLFAIGGSSLALAAVLAVISLLRGRP
jgi:MFS family permease